MTKNKSESLDLKKKGTQNSSFGRAEGAEEKTYTESEFQAEIQKRVDEALKSARTGWDKEVEERLKSEREDAAKLASMSAEERARTEMERKQKAFDEERRQYLCEKMEFEAARELAKNKLPLSFAKLLSAEDMDNTISNINVFKQEFMKAVEDALNERLKGGTPKIGGGVSKNSDPFLAGFGC